MKKPDQDTTKLLVDAKNTTPQNGSAAHQNPNGQEVLAKFSTEEKEFIEKKVIAYLRKGEGDAQEKCNEDVHKGLSKVLNKEHSIQDVENIVKAHWQKLGYFRGFNRMHPAKQTKIYLQHFHPKLKRNVIGGKIEVDGEYQSETDINTIMFDVRIFGVDIGKSAFYDLLNSSHTPQYHPIKEFFAKRKHWNCEGYIKRLSTTINTTTGLKSENPREDFFYYFLRKWLVGCISQVFDPHAKHNLFLILSGDQNVGKTSWFRQLMPREIERLWSEAKLVNYEKADLAMQLSENMIVFDDDMGIKKKADWSKIKSLLDTDYFKIRKPYGRGLEREKRIGSLCASTNEKNILGDPTGNRRLIPINVYAVDWDIYNKIDKERVWVEAYQLWEQGEKWELSRDDIKLLNDNTEEFTMPDPIKETIQKHLELPDPESPKVEEEMTATDIASYLNARIQGFRINPQSLGVRMHALGFKQETKWQKEGNTTQRVYTVVKKEGG